MVNARTITAVPLTTRNLTQLLSMSSGSAADVNNAGTLGRGTRNVNVNGNTTAGAYTLDGAYAPSAVPNPDTIASSNFFLNFSDHSTMRSTRLSAKKKVFAETPPPPLSSFLMRQKDRAL